MGSHDSWIDPAEVSDLAGEIFPARKVSRGEEEAFVPLPLLDDDGGTLGGDAGYEGFAVEKIAGRLRQIRHRAERSGLLVGTSPRQADPGSAEPGGAAPLEPFLLPSGGLSEQVAALVRWMSGCADRVVVLDELGYALGGAETPAGVRGAAVRLAQSWERSQPWLNEDLQAAEVPLAAAALAGGRVMSVLGVRCSSGFYCAAFIGDQLLSTSHAGRVRQALCLVFG